MHLTIYFAIGGGGGGGPRHKVYTYAFEVFTYTSNEI